MPSTLRTAREVGKGGNSTQRSTLIPASTEPLTLSFDGSPCFHGNPQDLARLLLRSLVEKGMMYGEAITEGQVALSKVGKEM